MTCLISNSFYGPLPEGGMDIFFRLRHYISEYILSTFPNHKPMGGQAKDLAPVPHGRITSNMKVTIKAMLNPA